MPEYHDCQRFLPDVGDAYQALLAVFASKRLGNLVEDLAVANPGGGARFGVAAATVYGLDGGYTRLGVGLDFNCLYLWQPTASSWSGAMVKVGTADAACMTKFDTTTSGANITKLEVRALAASTAGEFGYPTATRFFWSDPSKYYIGIKCGSSWCEVGQDGFFSATPPTLPPPAPGWLAELAAMSGSEVVTGAQLQQLVNARGWFDEQRIAPAAGGSATATTLSPLVIPAPGLSDLTSEGDFDNWRVVAFVYFPPLTSSAQSAAMWEYRTKFNYKPGWNAVSVCAAATAADCGPAFALPACVSAPVAPGSMRWLARIDAMTDGSPVHPVISCVKRIKDATHTTPATARWRWRAFDDTVWVSCAWGCCELEDPA